ncbi:prolyl oligopeptidase family serine peptidase [Cellulomonas bogoriensis]|uniref:Prolyl oligopeptidase n=1 Tax=Cellulomonas bogoriensis 69B4 = DSM 16987 TaxID=1386082 RepID=A0A0A0BXQ8_9CELL|nr:prolyl oligopeptidase family serine peptidase [Cellulomonas bogoriensis]KGM13178.1 prolyl oligopeptidase [Cellulomonas bogoriensis 69B4 = DSM 16987]
MSPTTPPPHPPADAPTATGAGDDPHLWLEDVDGQQALAWVAERNTEATDALGGPELEAMQAEILEVLDSADRIPMVTEAGGYLYNLWRDADHERGLWRRTTMAEYRTPDPTWEVLLDLDALAAAEGVSWVWHGASVLRPDCTRALVDLSPGGQDADVTREFDLTTRTWVEDGFVRPEAKGGLGWIDRDTVFVTTDTGPGTTTTSGYPRQARRWRRGTPLQDAPLVGEVAEDDLAVWVSHDRTPGFERDLLVRAVDFYHQEVNVLGPDDELVPVPVPSSAEVGIKREWLLVELREPWTVQGHEHPSGALLAVRLEEFLAGGRDLQVLFTPTDASSLAGYTWTRNHLVLTVLEHVQHHAQVCTPTPDGWVTRALDTVELGAPPLATVSVAGVDADESDDLWVTSTGFTTPTTLSRVTLGADGTPDAVEHLKQAPAFFEADHTVTQHMATSDDGTRVPYFLVTPNGVNGPVPTLLYGYGGFEISLTPTYAGGMGRAWLARGGAYAVANIRGGGEYGPRWHQAALKDKRHRAYEDFAAVARDLVERGVTTTDRLGIQGGSNGGLLMGAMLTLYPRLVGAVVCQVPLLDMRRYHRLLAGASWVAEYGDPEDPAQWEYIRTFSPYQLLREDEQYPPVLFTTSTRDDRVHPGHARKMAARMLQMGKDVLSYENIEGGHGGAATNAQAAHMAALAYRFLWLRLGTSTP